MIAEYIVSLARALGVLATFWYGYHVTKNIYLGIFVFILTTATAAFSMTAPITILYDIAKLYPPKRGGKYEGSPLAFVAIIILSLIGLVGSVLAVNVLPSLIPPLIKEVNR